MSPRYLELLINPKEVREFGAYNSNSWRDYIQKAPYAHGSAESTIFRNIKIFTSGTRC